MTPACIQRCLLNLAPLCRHISTLRPSFRVFSAASLCSSSVSCQVYSASACRACYLGTEACLAVHLCRGFCPAVGDAQLTLLPVLLLQDTTSPDAPAQLFSTEELKAYTMAGPSLKMSQSFYDDLFDAHLPIYAWVVDTGPQLQVST